MSSMPDLRGLKKGERFICGTNLKFKPEAKTVISMLCFDCGKSFATVEKKVKHVKGSHPKSYNEGNNGNACEVCKYKRKSKDRHFITVRAERLELPHDYPVADDGVDSSEDHEVPDHHEAQPQEQEQEDEEEAEGGEN